MTKLFLSAVSSEFVSYRNLLAGDLHRPNLELKEQDEIERLNTGGTTLEKLDDYIRQCDAVIHLIGKATGALPKEPAVAALLAKYPDFGARFPPLAELLKQAQPGFSYTQWEAYLARYHKRPIFVYRPTDFDLDVLHCPRGDKFKYSPAEAQSQKEHYRRICDLGQDRGQFLNEERLSSAVLRDLVEILPRLESSTDVRATKLRHTAERLIGRDDDLTRLDAAWNDPHKNVVIVRAWGGVGKTSLVATWMAELALKNWRGAERVFDWSFYSQGTRDQSSASADTFMAEALRTFGDPDPTLGSPWDRGARLAKLVGAARCLLVLDGLEPLQHPPGPMHGQLKDSGMAALLKGLAAQNAGLCVVTTREKVDDIKQHYGRTVDDVELTFLTPQAGAALLHYAGATRAGAKSIAPDDRELQAASREVRGHGLTLQLLGQYLGLAEEGDILKRDTVRLADADREYQNDATRPYGHAFKAMEAYEKWFTGEGEQGERQLAVLRLLGLFDRPASSTCLDALRAKPEIVGLTDAIVGLSPREWKSVLHRLEEINLLAIQDDGSIDCHPLIREYFAQQLRSGKEQAWQAAHRRLYEHLCETTQEGDQPTLEDFQPLYQAVAHGCHAGLQREACDKVYIARIMRRNEFYSTRKLGAYGSDLGAVACFFETPWSRVSPALMEGLQALLLNAAAFRLRALGRLAEALEPMRAGLENHLKQENWGYAASLASNLSELELTLGEVAGAVADAEQSVTYADRSNEEFQRESKRTTLADALHQAGRRPDAETRFREAEVICAKANPKMPLLSGLSGFEYCDLFLTKAERAAWQQMHESVVRSQESELRNACRDVSERAAQTIKIAEHNNWLLDIALDHLSLGRAAFYAAILCRAELSVGPNLTETAQCVRIDDELVIASYELNVAVDGFRRSGDQDQLSRGLLTRAWLRFVEGKRTGSDSAQSDLDEAWEIAERGSMKLFLADIHLYRARLFGVRNSERGVRSGGEEKYPWVSSAADLDAAETLINACGYHRRDEELADAKAALL
ncbi:MAG: hypothetical protein AABP62_06060 [Planctomycetota bacterium]